MCFFSSGSEKIVQLLLENGADASLRTRQGLSAEDLAAAKGKITAHPHTHIITFPPLMTCTNMALVYLHYYYLKLKQFLMKIN